MEGHAMKKNREIHQNYIANYNYLNNYLTDFLFLNQHCQYVL